MSLFGYVVIGIAVIGIAMIVDSPLRGENQGSR